MKTFVPFIFGILIVNLVYSKELYELARFSTPSRSYRGEKLPRLGKYLYRGMTAGQFNPDKAIRAMLGDQTANIESFLFTTVKSELLGKSFSRSVAIPYELRRLMLGMSASNERDAVTKTIALFNDYLNSMSDSEIINQYIFYRSGHFNDWPNDMVYSSLIQPAAGTYGYYIAMIKEEQLRSIDMNDYNQYHDNISYVYTRDVGEFGSFGYIKSEDIQGYQIRNKSGDKSWHRIEAILVKKENNHGRYLEVYSGKHPRFGASSCISFNDNKELVHCHYRPGSMQLSVPKNTDVKVTKVGYILICDTDDKTECLEDYGLLEVQSSLSVHAEISDAVKNLKSFGDKKIILVK